MQCKISLDDTVKERAVRHLPFHECNLQTKKSVFIAAAAAAD